MQKVDAWWHDGVIYQIYPRSYADTNQDGIGDLKGILGRLQYIASLGVSAIWLSPIYPSPDVDFGYDVADYKAIDPKYGTMQDFDELVSKAHSLNLRVILDLVLNHTSDQHVWFQEAKKSRSNPYHDWFLWRDPVLGQKYPNNWRSIFGGPAWEFVPEVGQFYYHMFTKEQPDLNWRNPKVYAEMLDVFRFWMKRGVDGFRLDVFNEYFKDSQFRSNPVTKIGIRPFESQEHLYDCDQPEMIQTVKDIRKVLDEKPGTYAVGESFMIDPKKAAKYCEPGMLQATFNFTFMINSWNPRKFLNSIIKWEDSLNENAWGTYVLSNHDTRRPASRYTCSEKDARLKVMATMLFTLRGTPFMYYGDEIGMRNVPISRSESQDPIGKKYWPAPIGRDGCRSPMQWDETEFSGFSQMKPWIKIHKNHIHRNTGRQDGDRNSLLNYYRRMIQLRKENPVLVNGLFMPLTSEPIYLLAYLRKDEKDTVLVALNFGHRRIKFFLGRELAEQKWELLISTHRDSAPNTSTGYIQLAGDEALVLKLAK